ncbi:MAG: hypothetical protein ACK4F5_16775 [Aliihoeflea sp.]
MFKFVRTATLAAIVGLGALAAMPASAEASNASFSFGVTSPDGAFSIQFGNPGPRYHRGQPRHHHHVRHCSDRQAVNRARDMGLRNARIIRSGHRTVEVSGWSHRRGYSEIVFSRAPHCPIVARY